MTRYAALHAEIATGTKGDLSATADGRAVSTHGNKPAQHFPPTSNRKSAMHVHSNVGAVGAPSATAEGRAAPTHGKQPRNQ